MLDTTRGAVPLQPTLVDPVPRDADEARVDPLRPGLWGLRLPLPYRRPRFVNCFLLARGDGYVLVDCGSAVGPGWAAVERLLAELGIAPGAIDELVLTHLHTDHGGLADEVVAHTGCRVLRGGGPPSSYDALRDPVVPLEVRRDGARREGVPAPLLDLIVDTPLAGESLLVHREPDRVLRAGDVLVTDDARWVVLDGPGHSPGQIVLHDPVSGWVLGADLAYPAPPYLEWGFSPDPVAESLASIERIAALRPTRFLPGHGAPDDAPDERLVAAHAGILGHVARHRAAVDPDVPRTAYEVACLIAGDDPDPDARGTALCVALSILEHLAAAGEVRAEIGASDGVRRWTAA